ncbi:GntR family transcriptional regulator [Flavobacteriaceae bacterium MHTCC 0001]
MSKIFDYIHIYKHQKNKRDSIVNGIIDAITDNSLKKGDPLPSVNRFIQKFGVARMTVVKALNILKERGVIISQNKVGYFVKDDKLEYQVKVFLFLNRYDSYHETIYNQILDSVHNPNISIDLFFHHCNPDIFNSILHKNMGLYGLYIVTCFDHPQIKTTLSQIPKRRLLQILRPPLLNTFPHITQDFNNGLKNELEKFKNRLEKYHEFVLIFSPEMNHPKKIKETFIEFCDKNNISFSVENKLSMDLIVPGKVFGVIEDSDLLSLIQFSEKKGFRIGNQVGVISYNETPMKQIIRDGITVISADFKEMGKAIAEFIMEPVHTQKVFTPKLIVRNSA